DEFNRHARDGVDPLFHRGESAYDQYYGDPSVEPNPCLAPLSKPPYYALRVQPGYLGTKGGLQTDEKARVLDQERRPIAGLFATGNTAASVMGPTYPGAGGTLGPALTFGYVAGKEAGKS
ncbi:MAG: FAD-binding protein, partial [Gemmatimonadetes bacterium]|nr:FAD-binding protein [Gemmatimonadota bacterium]